MMNNYKWQKVAESEQAFNAMFSHHSIQIISLFNKKVCLVKGNAKVYAIDDRCPHNGASLSMGMCNEKNEIICPLHRYPFNLETGKASAGMAISVQTYPIKIQENGVFVGMKKSWWEN